MEKVIYQVVEEDDGVEYIVEHEKEDEAIAHAKRYEEYARQMELSETAYQVFVVRVTIDENGNETQEHIWDKYMDEES